MHSRGFAKITDLVDRFVNLSRDWKENDQRTCCFSFSESCPIASAGLSESYSVSSASKTMLNEVADI